MKRGNEKKSRKIMFWTDIFLLSIKMDKTCGILIVGNHWVRNGSAWLSSCQSLSAIHPWCLKAVSSCQQPIQLLRSLGYLYPMHLASWSPHILVLLWTQFSFYNSSLELHRLDLRVLKVRIHFQALITHFNSLFSPVV